MADRQAKQRENADAKSRSCIESYEVSDQVLLYAKNLHTNVVSAVVKTKLLPRFIGPFYGRGEEGYCVYVQLTAQIPYTPHLLRWPP